MLSRMKVSELADEDWLTWFLVELKQREEIKKQKEEMPEEATFKPVTNNKIKADQLSHFQIGQGNAGM